MTVLLLRVLVLTVNSSCKSRDSIWNQLTEGVMQRLYFFVLIRILLRYYIIIFLLIYLPILKTFFLLFWGNFMLWFHWIRICNIEIHSQGFMVEILRHPLSFDFPKSDDLFYVGKECPMRESTFPSAVTTFPPAVATFPPAVTTFPPAVDILSHPL